MNDADSEMEEALAYIRRSTAKPIARFLDVVAEHRHEDPQVSGCGSHVDRCTVRWLVDFYLDLRLRIASLMVLMRKMRIGGDRVQDHR